VSSPELSFQYNLLSISVLEQQQSINFEKCFDPLFIVFIHPHKKNRWRCLFSQALI
jgi:hypothetical protein